MNPTNSNNGHVTLLRVRLSVVGPVAAFALIAAGCGADAGIEAGGGTEQPAAAAASDLVHIHRLQEVPRDDGLYVATHTGLFKIDGGEIQPVGGATHDLMGFTVAGSNDLLASGHPDLRVEALMVEGKPPLLGLVHSTDGKTWEPLSLLGEVDFHALVAAHDQVYGLDSQTGALMVSKDREGWDTRSEGLPFSDISVSPDDEDMLVAAAQDGIAASRDGGRSWAEVSSQRATYLSWTADGLFGVSPDGRVVRSEDEGQTWQSLGSVQGSPAALLATDRAVYVAVHEAGIMRSTDGGMNFEFLIRTDKK